MHALNRFTHSCPDTAAKAYLDQVKLLEDINPDDEAEGHTDALADRLRTDALDSIGHLQRKFAKSLRLPALQGANEWDTTQTAHSRLLRGHNLSVTALTITGDDRIVYSVSKDGVVIAHDIETGARSRFPHLPPKASRTEDTAGNAAEWVRPNARQASRTSLLAATVSEDGLYLATGGGDRKVHIWDAKNQELITSFPGHKDAVTGLAFRQGTHQLYSCSLDRSVKLWSLDDMAYVDTLFGHQAEVLCIDAPRGERALTSGADRTCRLWKIPEESQLIFRSHCLTVESCACVTGGEWVTGSADGSIQLWATTKKKAVHTVQNAHSDPAASHTIGQGTANVGAGGVAGVVSSWVGAVASCRGSDLVASGAGDGVIRFWGIGEGKAAGLHALQPLGGLPARGFVNGLKIAKSGKYVAAAIGQEPRMGRWSKDSKARNGVLIHQLELEST